MREVVGGAALALAYVVAAVVLGGMVLAFAPLILAAWMLDNP